jgi:Hsp20/alpha crystallin family
MTIHGGRKFQKQVNENNYLRVERSYDSFARGFSLANTVNSEAIKADYRERRPDAQYSEARGSQAQADPGQRRHAGCCGCQVGTGL